MTNQLRGVVNQHLTDVGGHYRGRIHHGVTQGLRMFTLLRGYPHRFQTKGRIAGGLTINGAKNLTGIDSQLTVVTDFRLTVIHAH